MSAYTLLSEATRELVHTNTYIQYNLQSPDTLQLFEQLVNRLLIVGAFNPGKEGIAPSMDITGDTGNECPWIWVMLLEHIP